MTTTSEIQQEDKRTLKSFFPIVEWLPKYQSSWLRPDLIAALTLWALLVPEAMAYAGIAGMPPETGLYAAPLAMIAYAIFGTSKQLNVGPSSSVAALSLLEISASSARPTGGPGASSVNAISNCGNSGGTSLAIRRISSIAS